MKKTRRIPLKKNGVSRDGSFESICVCIGVVVFVLVWCVGFLFAQAPGSCVVFGTVYDWNITLGTKLKFTVVEVTRTGTLLPQFQNKSFKANSTTGVVAFVLPRSSNAKIRANVAGFDGKVFFAIPDADSVALTALQPANISIQSQGGFVAIREIDGSPNFSIQGLNDTLAVNNASLTQSGNLITLSITSPPATSANFADSLRTGDGTFDADRWLDALGDIDTTGITDAQWIAFVENHSTGGGGANHNLLSSTHPDVLPASPVQGDVIVANGTPAWARLALGASGTVMQSNGTDRISSGFTLPLTTTINQILFSSAANVITGLATSSSQVLQTSAGGVPSFSATLPNAVQDNITRLATITLGVWNGTAILDAFVDNGITLTNITQITTRPITSLTATNWRIFASNGSGVVAEISNAAVGLVLKSNGTTALPSWQADATGAGGSATADSALTNHGNEDFDDMFPSSFEEFLIDTLGVKTANSNLVVSARGVGDLVLQDSTDITGTLTVSESVALNGGAVLADNQLLDLSAVVHDDVASQGILLPQVTSSPTSPSTGEGYLGWDQTNSVFLTYNGNEWHMPDASGELDFFRINEGAGITRGDVVYLSGATGSNPEVSLASNDDPSMSTIFGIAEQSGADASTILVRWSGHISDLNTSAFTVGVTLLLGIGGAFTDIHPTGTNDPAVLGTVSRSHPSQGTIQLNINNAFVHNTTFDGTARQIMRNSSAGNFAVATFTVVNDLERYASFGIVGSSTSVFAPNAVSFYSQGYGPMLFLNNGNVPFVWRADTTDANLFGATDIMKLTSDSKLGIRHIADLDSIPNAQLTVFAVEDTMLILQGDASGTQDSLLYVLRNGNLVTNGSVAATSFSTTISNDGFLNVFNTDGRASPDEGDLWWHGNDNVWRFSFDGVDSTEIIDARFYSGNTETGITVTPQSDNTIDFIVANLENLPGLLDVPGGGIGVGTITGLMQGNGTGVVTGIANSSTVGQSLRVTGAAVYGWGAVDLANAAAVTGLLPSGNVADAYIVNNANDDMNGVLTANGFVLGDDQTFTWGADSDWSANYDESIDNQLLFITTNTQAVAITDPMVEFLFDATIVANQQVFGIARGSQVSNTPLFTLDEDGDGVFNGTLGASNLSNTNTGDEVAASLTVQGIIEIATGTETNTGTDPDRAVSPDGLDDWTGSVQVTTVGLLAIDTGEIAASAVTMAKVGHRIWEKTISFPDTMLSAGPDTIWFGRNSFGVSINIDSIYVEADTDNYDISLVAADAGGGNAVLVDAIQATTNGNNHFYITETTITAATITNGERLGLALTSDNADYVFTVVYASW